ncbi:hypothetical protein FAM21834_00501 [Lentilactobacillus parabuchneri]|jgi:nucleoside-diphosphate-sugar epimerase|uniref:NAD(P)H-binding protein n=2 Tax=Lentilactobacillus parabuchneri TaxID=152331 RepID=A0A1X1FGM0_9LACO|nr:NAD(P)H-binding protein [Lentilactobacillus parabuchneri]KRM46858.1 oxidoreductase [Lentilactobacillus parabuchneri DSM 5707 = NBRC 107865]KRN78039.1 oxidoreductase [Lentilactobacillus parabuchneri]MBW0222611.1 NAD(P)H-binding protein [Lentilactobacillus parabuchneri]MBW0245801.1 NAD(P)H-binding protein [Lentilactobacillus parabuchneri]MBW0264234.1 NAD(P)H-binding protein [Lentilactobacillus parabuchneri]
MNLLILGANSQIARIVEQRILNETAFQGVNLTLGLRDSQRLAALNKNNRVTLLEVDLESAASVDRAVKGQDMVFVAAIDQEPGNPMTKNVIKAMQHHQVNRVLYANIEGLYDEVPGEFGEFNRNWTKNVINESINSDQLLADSGLDYTTLRLPFLNDRDEIKYTVTKKGQEYIGVSGSRKSIADFVLKMVKDPTIGSRESLGLANPDTQGEPRPVY